MGSSIFVSMTMGELDLFDKTCTTDIKVVRLPNLVAGGVETNTATYS